MENITSKTISYTKGLPYQTTEPCYVQTEIYPAKEIHYGFIHMTVAGFLTIDPGYAWDGPSGPTIDTDTAMRGSLPHDVLFQLVRLGLLEKRWVNEINKLFKKMLKEDGMNAWRRWVWVRMVGEFGKYSIGPASIHKIYCSPSDYVLQPAGYRFGQ